MKISRTIVPAPQLTIPLLIGLVLISSLALPQSDSVNAVKEIKQFQETLNAQYRDPEKSPMGSEKAKQFKGHPFFPVDMKFRVKGILTRTENSPFFKMKTTTSRMAEYRIYGQVEFSIDGKRYQVPIYQSATEMLTEKYKDYIFLPFTDLTNGHQSYSGGRYIDVRIPKDREIIIDFNQAYNPYCAYRKGYACPIVPSENNLDLEILAGVKFDSTQGH